MYIEFTVRCFDLFTEPRIKKFHYLTKGQIMASAQREPIWGSWVFAPSEVEEQSPWLAVRGASPSEADDVS
jgi:hypothetical protein